jgi:hypothetical protein
MVLYIPDAEKETKCEEGEEEKPSFYWRQTREDIELWIFVASDTGKKTVKVDLTNRYQRIVLLKFLQCFHCFGSRIDIEDRWIRIQGR